MKCTILYIDDEEANLRTFRSAFRRDFVIFTTTSGEKGLQILEEEKEFDVLITDQIMRDMNGVELLRRVFELKNMSKPARIMLSGYAEAKDVQEAKKKYGLSKFVSKPWNYEELKAVIESVIE